MNTTNYENAPATKLLATHCACCGRALVDAVSVERCIGPDCAERYNAPEAQSAADWDRVTALLSGIEAVSVDPSMSPREAANKLVFHVARPASALDRDQVEAIFEAIAALGFTFLAARIASRFKMSLSTPPSVEDLRKEYAKVRRDACYDNVTPAEFDALVRATNPKNPQAWVDAAHTVSCTCHRCNGTGRFIVGTENGAPKFGGGECFRCGGKGRQDVSDARRNKAYDSYSAARALRAG